MYILASNRHFSVLTNTHICDILAKKFNLKFKKMKERCFELIAISVMVFIFIIIVICYFWAKDPLLTLSIITPVGFLGVIAAILSKK